MKTTKSKNHLQKIIQNYKQQNKSIGLVLTMGYLHQGHLNLIQKSLKENQVTVVSIFVNPLQFGPKEDFNTYPRDLKRDLSLLKKLKIDLVFLPDQKVIYPDSDHQTHLRNESLEHLYCGKSRPVFFQGVLTVVLKFFHLIQPDRSYFGKKDYQQFFMIKKMVRDLDLKIKIRSVPTQREKNGLALSSRNAYFSQNPDHFRQSSLFYQTLKKAQQAVKIKQIETVLQLIQFVKNELNHHKDFKIDYVELVHRLTLTKADRLEKSIILAAVFYKKVRLIDNIELK